MQESQKIQELENLVIQAWKDVAMCAKESRISKTLYMTAVQRANQLELKLLTAQKGEEN